MEDNKNVQWLKDNLVKISLFIIALSVAYYLVIYIPHKNQQEIDLKKQQYQDQLDAQKQKDQSERQKQLDAQKQATENKSALDKCMSDAETNYSYWWRGNCRSRGLLPAGCDEATVNLSYDDYKKQNNLTGTGVLQYWDEYWKHHTQKLEQCTCSLPTSLADSINSDRQQAKDLCLKQYPQK